MHADQVRRLLNASSGYAFVEALPEPALVCDRDGTIVVGNHHAAALFGRPTPAELQGLSLLAFVVADDRGVAREQLHGAIAGHTAPPGEYRVCPVEGEVRWVAVSASALVDAAGQVAGLVALLRDVTQHKRTEEALRERQEQLRRVIDQMPVMLDAMGDGLTFIAWNRECERVSGYSAAEIIGNPHAFELLYPDPEYRARRLSEWNRGDPDFRNWEWELTTKNGRSKTIAWSNISTSFPTPGWTTWAIGVDVTEQRRAEAALRQQTAVIALLQAVAVAVNESNTIAEAVQFCLDRVCAHTGWPVGHAYMVGEDDGGPLVTSGLWHLADAAQFAPFRQATEQTYGLGAMSLPGSVLASRKPVWLMDVTTNPPFLRAEQARQVGLKAGFAFPVLVQTEVVAVLEFFAPLAAEPDVALLDVMGQIGTQLGRAIERAHAAEHLQQERNFVSAVLDTAGALVSVIDRNERIVRFNRACERTTGYTFAEVAGKNVYELLIPLEQREAARAVVRNVGPGMPPSVGENDWLTKDGQRRLISWSNTVLPDRSGEGAYFIGTGIDITERRLAEERIKASLAEKEVLLREIHHRVKNNLQIISSLLRMQSTYTRTSQVEELLKESQNRVRSMALVHEKLYQSPDLAEIDFAAYSRALTAQLLRSYGLRDDIRIHTQAEIALVGIDSAIPCGLILSELVSNSLKHAFPHGRTGAIWISLALADDHTARLTVRDNGIGLPAGIELHKLESLGLQLVHALIRQLHGTVRLESDQGTIWTINFPLPRGRREARL